MTINELFKSFTDIEFQANRLMKMKVIDEQHLRQFDERSEEVRVQVLNLDLSEALNEELIELGRINCDFLPPIHFGHKVLNVLTFGFYKKRYISKEREIYFKGEINMRKQLFHHAENQLKEI
jgi:hypothetical protein